MNDGNGNDIINLGGNMFKEFNPYEWYRKSDEFGEFYNTGFCEIRVEQNIYNKACSGDKKAIEYIEELINHSEDKKIGLSYSTSKSDGVKYDTGKPLVGTLCRIFPNALLEVGKCIEFGTHKYPEVDNWQRVDDAFNRYQDAMIRHLLKHNIGKEEDEETGLYHLSHMAWNALAILELYIRSKENVNT